LAKAAKNLNKESLIHLLKNPVCVGLPRRIILDELGQRTGQHFAGVWDFVAWAEEHEPTLDLHAPWKMPAEPEEP
jgi:hypothetical protein